MQKSSTQYRIPSAVPSPYFSYWGMLLADASTEDEAEFFYSLHLSLMYQLICLAYEERFLPEDEADLRLLVDKVIEVRKRLI